MTLQDFHPQTDTEMKTRVRGITDYDNTPDQLADADLSELLDEAKSNLYDTTGSTAWYSDGGLNKALRYGTALLAKNRVENEMVLSWNFGDETVRTANDVPREQSSQLQDWADKVAEGLSEADDTEHEEPGFSLSSGVEF